MTTSASRRVWLIGIALAATACGSLLGLDNDDAGVPADTPDGARESSSGASGSSDGASSSSSGAPGSSSGSGPMAPRGTPLRVFAGGANACAWSDTGVLACWGANGSGQLAQGGPQQDTSSEVPLRVPGVLGAISTVSIGHTALGVVAAGRILSAGTNQHGELGDGSQGRSSLGLLNGIDTVRDLSLGASTTCAVQENGRVSCWGLNGSLQAGQEGAATLVTTPTPVTGALVASRIAVGDGYTCASSTEAIECWGGNTANRLGHDGPGPTHRPGLVLEIEGAVTALSLGATHACAIVGGAARCWGSNVHGELGTGMGTAPTVGAVSPSGLGLAAGGVTSICAGTGFSCAVQSGAAKCWGLNDRGQLGVGDQEAYVLPNPIALAGDVREVACGTAHACALRTDGEVYCWGQNENGQLGAGLPAAFATEPMKVRWDLL